MRHASAPFTRIVEIMAWIGDHYGVEYKPNTREVIRFAEQYPVRTAVGVAAPGADPIVADRGAR